MGRPRSRQPAHARPVRRSLVELQRIDEHIDRTYRIALVHPVIEVFRQQRRLLAIHPLNETLQHSPRDSARESYHRWGFHTVWTRTGHPAT